MVVVFHNCDSNLRCYDNCGYHRKNKGVKMKHYRIMGSDMRVFIKTIGLTLCDLSSDSKPLPRDMTDFIEKYPLTNEICQIIISLYELTFTVIDINTGVMKDTILNGSIVETIFNDLKHYGVEYY